MADIGGYRVVRLLAALAAALVAAALGWFFWQSRAAPPERSVDDVFFVP